MYPPGITSLRQIHSGIVLEAAGPNADRFAEGDALISKLPGVTIGVRTADCVPVLIADSRTHAVAAIHAGWRGTAAGIVANVVKELITSHGSRAEDLHASIGPAIGPCCYEVSPDVAHRFETWDYRLAGIAEPVKIDLPAINARQLSDAGISDIWQANECTFCESKSYFSYRREKEAAGRMISFIGAF